ncbi:hypothetical protein KAU32_04800 [bacterium]|nr:hypothetical protein [bacterium]
MRRTIISFMAMLLLSSLIFGTTTEARKIIEQDDRQDKRLIEFMENEYINSFILSDRTLGIIANIKGSSYYVKRIEDAENFQLRLIDLDTGAQISSLPYFKMEDFTIDPTGNYYIITLGNGEVLEIPVWMESNSVWELLAEYSGIPIYLDDRIIGVTLFLTDNIQLSLYSPFYGLFNVQFTNLSNKLFEEMKLDLLFDQETEELLLKKEQNQEKKNEDEENIEKEVIVE